ncbi:biopolymer transporter ExbD [Oscillatoriales cyanobacterium LEGE 11467]|uniref:Biopolymer transporter ExbD n=1 Tax=Zarconia navalis LEGE 11467 TaxID=1828826 RepID=A0A928Z870_9CYAN|nr:biopolymer transporter ExbD [Zarconia navalis]MBE9040388.1 biopolymer transporter ExbD [Zarconia navalis LEGE 11467]
MRLVDDEPDLPAQINIVPAIDIIFVILAFFILASLFLDRTEGLPVSLPNATTAQTQDRIPFTITLYPQGEIFLEGQLIGIDGLEGEIRSRMQSSSTVLVVLQADEEVRHGTVVEVMDRLRRIEGVNLAIATTALPSNP